MASKKKTIKKESKETEDIDIKNIKEKSSSLFKDLPSDYLPVVCILPKTETKFSYKAEPEISSNIDRPLFSLGFHHFIHFNKDKMRVTEQFEGKKKIYFVMHLFDTSIDEVDTDIDKTSIEYFNLYNTVPIVSRAFFKLWELLWTFDLGMIDTNNFVTLHIAESPGGFVQAISLYREMFASKETVKKDKYYLITLNAETNTGVIDPNNLIMNSQLVESLGKKLIMHKTYSKEEALKSKDKDNGDITQLKTLNIFEKEMEEKAHLITADGGFVWKNENTQEQEVFPLLIGEILLALRRQKNGGNFVCKLYETFTKTTCKLIYALTTIYDKIYFMKPLLSHASNSEKYLVCQGFHENLADKLINELTQVLTYLQENHQSNLVDIFPTIILPDTFLHTITWINTVISNKQLICINNIVKFIGSQNYYGDEYQQRRLMQVEASKYWINSFYPQKNEFTKILKYHHSLKNEVINSNTEKIKTFSESI